MFSSIRLKQPKYSHDSSRDSYCLHRIQKWGEARGYFLERGAAWLGQYTIISYLILWTLLHITWILHNWNDFHCKWWLFLEDAILMLCWVDKNTSHNNEAVVPTLIKIWACLPSHHFLLQLATEMKIWLQRHQISGSSNNSSILWLRLLKLSWRKIHINSCRFMLPSNLLFWW